MLLKEIVAKINVREEINSQEGLLGSASAYFLSELFKVVQKPICLVLSHSQEAEAYLQDLKFFLGAETDLLYLPSLDILPYYGLSANPTILAERQKILFEIFTRTKPYILILTAASLMRLIAPKEIFVSKHKHIHLGDQISRDDLLQYLQESGYTQVPVVDDVGTYSKRGGIVDIYSPNYEHPLRLELLGDAVESLRFFDTETQRSIKESLSYQIIPARSALWNNLEKKDILKRLRDLADEADIPKPKRLSFIEAIENNNIPNASETFLPVFYKQLASIFDYTLQETLWITVNVNQLEQHWQELQNSYVSAHAASDNLEKIILPEKIILTWEHFQKEILKKYHFAISENSLNEPIYHIDSHEILQTLIKTQTLDEHFLDPLLRRIKEWQMLGYKILFTASSTSQLLRLEDLLERHGVITERLQNGFLQFSQTVQQGPFLTQTAINKGFVWAEEKIVIITDEEIFGKKHHSKSKNYQKGEAFTSFEDLKPGNYIVHEQHGLGIYRNLVTLELEGVKNDFLLLEYLGGDKLYLPVYRMNLISRYLAAEDSVPALDKLGGFTWEKTLARVKKSVKAMAADLIKLYAERASLQGHAFPLGGELMEEFEAAFPFDETEDQLRAIKEVAGDMTSPRPMDRLICGDVGFGKTEVAMRAAYQAILGGKQAALIVPTTVLAQQHYESFKIRFGHTAVRLAMLSRFVSAAEQKNIIAKLLQGEVDLVIGTHRLLSTDVHFKDLGLLINDEEHRFGVSQKEKIKLMRKQVDVLAMTATPIPRTLNMSLSGIRDLSIINTAPKDRLSIRTFVSPYNEGLIREAILQEISRGGQVYFVHNRVQDIHNIYEQLVKMVPEAKIGIGHGQMEEHQLEDVMIQFIKHEINVLLCTTIIESGLDVPNANTIIIHRADTFGLAQLYQLRGRVGRSHVRAYAYLLTPKDYEISSLARSRLSVIARYTELGSGFKIAAHDMEIRGVGNFLGQAQSGHIASVGYEMYTHLLEEAILELQGKEHLLAPEPELKFKLAAYIPEQFVEETTVRLTLYKRLSMADHMEAVEKIEQEIQDRFGNLGNEAQNLLWTMKIKVLAKSLWIHAIKQESRRMVIVFDQNSKMNRKVLQERVQKEPERYKWLSPVELAMGYKPGKEDKAFESLQSFLMSLQNE